MASGVFIYARKALAEGDINLDLDVIRAMLLNTTSTVSGANPRGTSASANKGFNDSGVTSVSSFTTLGEYLPGDSSSSTTRVTISLERVYDEANGRLAYKVTDGSGTGQAISFGSQASATLSGKGILIYARPKKATTTFTFGDTEFDDVDEATITLIDYAGKSLTYRISNDAGATEATDFNSGANIAACTANFKIAVEHADNHNGTIAVTDVGSGVIIMTQAKPGRMGNTAIANSNWDSICDVNVEAAFTGGGDDPGSDDTARDIPIAAIDFSAPVNGTGSTYSVQFTDNHYVLTLS